MATFKRLMIAADMLMICNLFFNVVILRLWINVNFLLAMVMVGL
jgi:hypothetical protein